jgi:hypothetical protein
MPRREGGKGTEITTLSGGQNLGEIQDIEYFQQKLYHALNVPISRLQQSQGFSIGRSNEITRDEVKFNKFIVRLRKKFSQLFSQALRVQLIAKNIIRADEWETFEQDIRYDYLEDNHYSELKDAEIMMQRVQMLQTLDPYVGKYYSMQWIRKNILQMDEAEIDKIKDELETEKEEHLDNAELQGDIEGVKMKNQQDYVDPGTGNQPN